MRGGGGGRKADGANKDGPSSITAGVTPHHSAGLGTLSSPPYTEETVQGVAAQCASAHASFWPTPTDRHHSEEPGGGNAGGDGARTLSATSAVVKQSTRTHLQSPLRAASTTFIPFSPPYEAHATLTHVGRTFSH